MKKVQKPKLYVGIGASAGGLEALEDFFSNLSADTGLAYIVIQHLSPDYKSMMDELMGKYTDMPVTQVKEVSQEGVPVEANRVYLIPPKKNLTIAEGRLHLSPQQDHMRNLNLPIDIFLKSLAQDQAGRSVGIILSGTGSDGTRGVKAIKENEGLVMVQTVESARFDGMPRGVISSGMADFILPPQEMPSRLVQYALNFKKVLAEPEEVIQTDEDAIRRILTILRENSRVDFTYYKPSTIVRRIERRMSINSVSTLWDYVRFLEKSTPEITQLSRELLIGVTNFFRDKEAFDHLRTKVIPHILDNNSGKEIRFWVPGCSTGEEAYSLAIITREVLEERKENAYVKIFATDVDKSAILKAGEGLYPESIAADVSPGFLAKYFHRRENNYQISRTIREMVVFARQNVVQDPPFTNIDLISCRNLLIYFQPVLQKKVIDFFNFSLVKGGYLFLGSSESVGDMSPSFEAVVAKWKIFRSRGRAVRGALSSTPSLSGAPSGASVEKGLGESDRTFHIHNEERLMDRLLRTAVEGVLPLTILVNDHFEVLHVIGETKGYFRVPHGRMSNDITKMAHPDLSIPLATGLPKLFKDGTEVVYSNIRLKDQDPSVYCTLRMRLLPRRNDQVPVGVIFVQENETAPAASEDSAKRISYDAGKEAQHRIDDLEQELQFTRESLQATIEELETSNEELQATNEELLASNEELQSTNEELQSVNEELYTVNAEYQNKILELTEANNDMDNLLSNTEVATIFLDENLEIRRFTENIDRFFKVIEGDIGRPLADLASRFPHVDLEEKLQAVIKSGQPLEEEIQREGGEWFLLKILPYMVGPQEASGLVISFLDINRTKEIQSALKQSLERMHFAEKTVLFGTWNWEIGNNRLYWSNETARLFGVDPQRFDNRYESFLEMVHPDDRTSLKKAVEKAIKGNGNYEVIHRILWPDNSIHWMKETGVVYRDAQGAAQRMVGIVQDVTVLRTVQGQVMETQNYYEMFFNRMGLPALILRAVFDDQERLAGFLCIEANSAALRFLEMSRSQLLGHPLDEHVKGGEVLMKAMKDLWGSLANGRIQQRDLALFPGQPAVRTDIFAPAANQGAVVFHNLS